MEDDDTGRVINGRLPWRSGTGDMQNTGEAALPFSPECFSGPTLQDLCWRWNSGSANKSLKVICRYRCQSGRVISNFSFFKWYHLQPLSPWSRMKYLWEHGEDNNVKAWWILLSPGRPAWRSLFHSPNCPRHLSQIGDSVSQMEPTVRQRDGWSQAVRLSERELHWSKSRRQSKGPVDLLITN